MATVVLSREAVARLDDLIASRSLPADTRARVRTSLELLAAFPRIGVQLEGHWRGFRFVLGPWPWMIVVYEFDEATDEVQVDTIQDSRSAHAVTAREGEPPGHRPG